MEMIKLQPAFKDYLWGGEKLKTDYGKQTDLQIVAESWELSNHNAGESIVTNGTFKGMTFGRYLESNSKDILGTHAKAFEAFPILIKLIDAKRALSVQVHPNDEYAQRVEKEYGKTEMWYILDCEEDAFLYYGVKKPITREEFAKRIENNTVIEILNKVFVRPGDVFFIEAGTIHAIGEGIVICEIQQNSNTTYRVYDYDRKDAMGNTRELHVDKALEVSRLTPNDPGCMSKIEEGNGFTKRKLASCKYFTTYAFTLNKSLTYMVDETSFRSLIITRGKGTIETSEQVLEFTRGDSLFIPANMGVIRINGNCEFILTEI